MIDIWQEFLRIFHTQPEVVAQAPGRVNLIGEHIDYSDGFVLPFAIHDVTTVAISRREDSTITLASMQRPKDGFSTNYEMLVPLTGEHWARYPLGVLWALREKLGTRNFQGLNILIDGKVPLGAGLSSSAALECSVAVA